MQIYFRLLLVINALVAVTHTMERVIEFTEEDLADSSELAQTISNYKFSCEYEKIVEIIKNAGEDTKKAIAELMARKPIFSAKISQTWLFHQAIRYNDLQEAKLLLAQFGDDVIAKHGDSSDTLPFAQLMADVFPEGNEEMQQLIKECGGKVMIECTVGEWKKENPGKLLPKHIRGKKDSDIVLMQK